MAVMAKKLQSSDEPVMANKDTVGSSLFTPFRIVGKVTENVQPGIHYLGGIPYITTSVGSAFQTFDLESLNLCFVGPTHKSQIKLMKAYQEFILAVNEDNFLSTYQNAKMVASIQVHETVVGLENFGDIAVALTAEKIHLYEFPTLKIMDSISLTSGKKCTHLCHPVNYLNKVAVVYADGDMELWNIKTLKLIHQFKTCKFPTQITCMIPSPVVDIIVVGLDNGDVVVCDLRQDLKLFTLSHKGKVEGLSFRTDVEESSQLVVASSDGVCTLWDLSLRQILYHWNTHSSKRGGPSVNFIQGQPLLITCGGDNAIKEWIIEDNVPRLLKSRTGHSSPPNTVMFYEEGDSIITSSEDQTLRLVSLIKDSQSGQLSQGSIDAAVKKVKVEIEELLLPPIISVGVFETKDLKWDNLVTAHQNSSIAYTWRVDHRKLGKHKLQSRDSTDITCVQISPCGNFALLGCKSGAIDIFNIQSGQFKRHLSNTDTSPIICLGPDSVNSYLISVQASGIITCWDTISNRVKYAINLEGSITKAMFDPEIEMVAVVVEKDNQVLLIDTESQNIVRKFKGQDSRIIDIDISADGRWMLVAAADKTVTTWDIASSTKIDSLMLNRVPKTIRLSPKLKYLAVTVEGEIGIHILSNKSLYTPVTYNTNQWSLPREANVVSLETDEITEKLCTFFIDSRSKFVDIYHLNDVRSKTKPLLPPPSEENSKLSFFLDSSLQQKRSDEAANRTSNLPESAEKAALGEKMALTTRSVLQNEDLVILFDHLKDMSCAQADFEIRTADSLSELKNLFGSLLGQLKKGTNADLASAFLHTAFEAHLKLICDNMEELKPHLQELFITIKTQKSALESLFHNANLLTLFSRDM